MQAIITKYFPATNTKGARIKATCQRGSRYVSWDYALSTEENHKRAASWLCARFADEDFENYGEQQHLNWWSRPLVSGFLPCGNYAHVFTT